MIETKGETIAELNAASLAVAKAIRGRVSDMLAVAERDDVLIHASTLLVLARTAETTQRVGLLALGGSSSRENVTIVSVQNNVEGDPFDRIARRLAALNASH